MFVKTIFIMKNKYIITGVNGKIGSEFVRRLKKRDFIGIYRTGDGQRYGNNFIQLDLESWDNYDAHDFIGFNTVVHTAAKTHIDDCEVDKNEGKDSQAWRDNVIATKKLSEFCIKTNKKLIMLSTECVFNGKIRMYSEEDKLYPINWYGKTKLKAENIANKVPNHSILRSIMAYGGRSPKKDMVFSMVEKLRKGIKIEAVYDQIIAYTYVGDIVEVCIRITEKDLKGVFHLSGPDALSPYELALKLCKKYGFDRNLVIPVTLEKYFGKRRAKLRLKYSIFDNNKLARSLKFKATDIDKGLDLAMRSWGYL